MAESESVTREEEPQTHEPPTCPHCGLVANSLERTQAEKDYRDAGGSIEGFKAFKMSDRLWATCPRGHRWKLESRPEPCEPHRWLEVTASGDARRAFLCHVCGATKQRDWPTIPADLAAWPGSCANAEDLNREPTDKETTLRLASLATLRSLEQNLRNCAREEEAEAVEYALSRLASPGVEDVLILHCPPGMSAPQRESWQVHVSIRTGRRVIALRDGMRLEAGKDGDR